MWNLRVYTITVVDGCTTVLMYILVCIHICGLIFSVLIFVHTNLVLFMIGLRWQSRLALTDMTDTGRIFPTIQLHIVVYFVFIWCIFYLLWLPLIWEDCEIPVFKIYWLSVFRMYLMLTLLIAAFCYTGCCGHRITRYSHSSTSAGVSEPHIPVHISVILKIRT